MRAWMIVSVFLLAGCDDGGEGSADGGAPDVAAAEAGQADAMSGDAALVDAEAPHPGLMDPTQAQEEAPELYAVRFETTAGDFVVNVTRAWAPLGADRFYNLARVGYFDDCAFFRVLDGFVAQTGINGDPLVAAVWQGQRMMDDPVVETNTRGRVTYATAGPDTRRTQIFFNFGDNSRLDAMGFAPFGEVDDLTALEALYSGYGDGPPSGAGPDQRRLRAEGNDYLRAEYPELDYIIRARPVE